MPSYKPKTIPRELRGSRLDTLLTEHAKISKSARATYLRHQNILNNRIHSLEKSRYELSNSYTDTIRELDYELSLLKIQRANGSQHPIEKSEK